MSFITPPSPPTDRQKANTSTLVLLNNMKFACKLQFEIAWKKREHGEIVNKTQAEAQAFFDSYGVKAVLAFELHSKLQELIYLTDDSWVALVPPYFYTENQDGTVVIGELRDPPAPPPEEEPPAQPPEEEPPAQPPEEEPV